MAPKARPPDKGERPNGQPGRSTPEPSPKRVTPTLAEVADLVSTEAAEQLQYELHLVGECRPACPWCSSRWAP